jgi:hypothetical protein
LRIKYVVPFPLDETGMAISREQVPQEILGPNTTVECGAVCNSCTCVDGCYEPLLMEWSVYAANTQARPATRGHDRSRFQVPSL